MRLTRSWASSHLLARVTWLSSGACVRPRGSSVWFPQRRHTAIRPFVSGEWCSSRRAATDAASGDTMIILTGVPSWADAKPEGSKHARGWAGARPPLHPTSHPWLDRDVRWPVWTLRWRRKNRSAAPGDRLGTGRLAPVSRDARGAVLVFDGDCGFCTTAARWAEKGFHHGERAEAWQVLGPDVLSSIGLSLHDAEQAAWWLDADGRRERGHRAVGRALQAGGGRRRVAGRLILTPPASWLAAGVYRLVVRWRYRLPGGSPACRPDHRR